MTIEDVLKVLLLILSVMLVFQAYWLAGTALFPRLVGQARDRYKKPFRTTLIGLAVVVPAFFLGFMVLGQRSQPVFKVIGFVIGSVPLIAGLIGSAGLCQLIGLGLPAPGDQSQNWRRVWRGGWVLNFCYLLPFAGWFVLLPWGIISGCGVFVTSLSGNGAPRNRSRNTGRGPKRTSAPEPAAKLDDDSPRSSRLQRSQIPSGDEGSKPKPRPRRPRRPSRPKQEE
ncbi:MAG: hypothetical protein QF721_10665 [Verrucomicrobiota bacterium]|jgi:hypothetical protein|nr:hypothetical protein [Verrucomicrobiota bacterium]MDP7049905.1 hypothetical protein [Verrucomicrobiota bacterium]